MLRVQVEIVPILAEALFAVGLLDPVSAQTGTRVSEEILEILANLAAVPSARASHCVTHVLCPSRTLRHPFRP